MTPFLSGDERNTGFIFIEQRVLFWISIQSDKQDSIPVGCIPPAWKPYLLQFLLSPPDVAMGGEGVGTRQMNKF